MSTNDDEVFVPTTTKEFRLEVVIDNKDADGNPDTPFTLTAYLGEHGAARQLRLADELAIIEGTVPEQLRLLAEIIEHGKVFIT